MSEPIHVPKMACSTCPYRRDTPSGIWSEEEYRKLPLYDEDGGHIIDVPAEAQEALGGKVRVPEMSIFNCHHSQATGRHTICRGWLSVHRHHPAVRLAAALGGLQVEDVPTEDESDAYYASGAEACEAGLRDIKCPSPEANAKVEGLLRRGVGKIE